MVIIILFYLKQLTQVNFLAYLEPKLQRNWIISTGVNNLEACMVRIKVTVIALIDTVTVVFTHR